MKPVNDSYVVVTEFGSVLVTVNPQARNGLENELLQFAAATEEDHRAADFETPLRAFAAKMVDIIEGAGFEGVDVSGKMRDMLVREKATSELGRIERWARDNLAQPS